MNAASTRTPRLLRGISAPGWLWCDVAAPGLDAVVVEPVRALQWDSGTRQRYLAANPETRMVMQRHLARDLAGKLQRRGGAFLASPSPGETAGSAADRRPKEDEP